MKESLINASSKIVEYLLDTVAPPDPAIRDIERMGGAGFSRRVTPPEASERIEDVTSLFSYKDPLVRAAVLEVKSYGNKKVARTLAEAVYEQLLEELSEKKLFEDFSASLLLPVPMTRRSLRKRGWNQCELVASAIKRIDASALLDVRTDILVKSHETGDQVGKSRAERFENLRDCFAVKDAEIVRGRNVIVLDDIVTTGATLSEARKALKKAGAKKVWCVAIAH